MMEEHSLESEREKRLAAAQAVETKRVSNKRKSYAEGMSAEDIARAEVADSIFTLIEIRDDEGLPAGQRISAAMALLDRGIGKAGDASDTSGRGAQRSLGLVELRVLLSELEARRGDVMEVIDV